MPVDRPNILLIWADELRADGLACFGNPVVKTPSLDRLAESGTRFTQCMVTQPTCTPCRASVLTGCFPSALRSRMVGCRTPDDPRFLPRILAKSGYRTASMGKIHLVPQVEEPDAVLATRQDDGAFDYYGFQAVDLVNGHGDCCFGPRYNAWLRKRVPDLDERRRNREQLCALPDCYRWPLPPEVHSSEYIAARAVGYLQRAAEGNTPFFLHCSFPDPHHPFTVPEPYASMYAPTDMPDPLPPITESVNPPAIGLDAYKGENYGVVRPDGRPCDRIIGTPPRDYETLTSQDWRVARAVTAGMVTLLDDCIGRIINALDATGLRDNTIVVFVSDHGDYLGDYGLLGKGLHYDCILRTPLIMSGPGIPQGRQVDRIASVADIGPTLLSLVSIDEPDTMQGLSMKQGLTDEDAWPRDAALTENDDDMASVRIRTLTTADWKLSVYAGSTFGELYDRHSDPDEGHNLWDSAAHADTRARLTERLTDHMLCAVDPSNPRVQRPTPAVTKHVPRGSSK